MHILYTYYYSYDNYYSLIRTVKIIRKEPNVFSQESKTQSITSQLVFRLINNFHFYCNRVASFNRKTTIIMRMPTVDTVLGNILFCFSLSWMSIFSIFYIVKIGIHSHHSREK